MLKIAVRFAVLMAMSGYASMAWSQPYPSKPVRLVVPWPAGGNADVVARTVAQKMSEGLGQAFVVDNRAGAGGNIGMEAAAKSPADGYTLALVITANAVNATLYSKINFDLVRDFAPIGPIAALPLILVVHPSVAAGSVAELVSLARKQPGKLNYASGGSGTLGHLAAEMFKSMTRVDMVHVPYKGATPAVTDLISGQVQVFFDGVPSALPHVRAGSLRVLAITTPNRSPALPEVATVSEAGLPGFEVTGWFGLMAPSGTDPQIVARLNGELNRVLALPDVKQRFANLGLEIMTATPPQFGSFVQTEIAKWATVIKEANVRVD